MIRVFAAAALGAVAVVVPAHASSPTLTGPDVVRYAPDLSLRDVTTVLYQGARLPDGGCAFHGSVLLPAGHAPVTEVEVAYRASTCQSLRERGSTTAVDPPTLGGGSASDQVTVGTQTLRLPSTFASIHGWFHDPPGIHVNDVTNSVAWSYDGSCALPPGTTATMSYQYNWFTPTGWSLEGNSWSHGASCSSVYSSSTVHFQNRLFCAAISPILFLFPTDTYYQPNSVTGYGNGSAFYSWSWSKSGPCSALLSYQNQLT